MLEEDFASFAPNEGKDILRSLKLQSKYVFSYRMHVNCSMSLKYLDSIIIGVNGCCVGIKNA